MKIGYARVSAADQNLDRQLDALKAAGVEKVYTEKASGKDTADRPILKEVLGFAREGDSFIVSAYDRLARSTRDLLDIVDGLRARGVKFISLRENIDTGGPAGHLILTMFGALAQFERKTIKERQREGIDAARRRGRHLGRPPAQYPPEWKPVYAAWERGELSAAAAWRKLSLTKSTFYKPMARAGRAPKRWTEGKPSRFEPATKS